MSLSQSRPTTSHARSRTDDLAAVESPKTLDVNIPDNISTGDEAEATAMTPALPQISSTPGIRPIMPEVSPASRINSKDALAKVAGRDAYAIRTQLAKARREKFRPSAYESVLHASEIVWAAGKEEHPILSIFFTTNVRFSRVSRATVLLLEIMVSLAATAFFFTDRNTFCVPGGLCLSSSPGFVAGVYVSFAALVLTWLVARLLMLPADPPSVNIRADIVLLRSWQWQIVVRWWVTYILIMFSVGLLAWYTVAATPNFSSSTMTQWYIAFCVSIGFSWTLYSFIRMGVMYYIFIKSARPLDEAGQKEEPRTWLSFLAEIISGRALA